MFCVLDTLVQRHLTLRGIAQTTRAWQYGMHVRYLAGLGRGRSRREGKKMINNTEEVLVPSSCGMLRKPDSLTKRVSPPENKRCRSIMPWPPLHLRHLTDTRCFTSPTSSVISTLLLHDVSILCTLFWDPHKHLILLHCPSLSLLFFERLLRSITIPFVSIHF